MKGLFITGTDTGVGKTVIAMLLARYISACGYRVIRQKWFQTGCRGYAHSDLAAQARHAQTLPYVFSRACSPHLAAQLAGKPIRREKIIRAFRALSRSFDFVLAEGAGGVLVPYTRQRLATDIVQELRLPALLVAENKLGALNHTLLSIEALSLRGIGILGIVFNRLRECDRLILNDNPKIIKGISRQRVLGELPYQPDEQKLYRDFIPLGKKILRLLLKNG